MFTSLPNVQDATRNPSIIAAFLHFLNGVTFIGEGIQMGLSEFVSLARSALVSTAVMMAALKAVGYRSLSGIWLSLGLFYVGRCIGTLTHFFFTGPFARRRIEKTPEGSDGRYDIRQTSAVGTSAL